MFSTSGETRIKAGATITGKLTVTLATINDDATMIGALEVTNSESPSRVIIRSGIIGGSVLFLNTSTNLTADSTSLTTVTVKSSNSRIRLCNSTITSSLYISQPGNILVETGPSCVKGTIQGGVHVGKGSGMVTIKGVDLSESGVDVSTYSGDIALKETAVGYLTITQHSGNVLSTDSTVHGDISITTASGNFELRNTDVLGSISYSVVSGNIIFDRVYVKLGVKFLTVSGNVQLTSLKADGEVEIARSSGNVIVTTLHAHSFYINELSGKAILTAIRTQVDTKIVVVIGDVILRGSDSGYVLIQHVSGSVTVEANSGDLDVTIKENSSAVRVFSNVCPKSLFTLIGNTGGVILFANTIGTVDCTDNYPLPTGSANSLSAALGQCTAF